MTATEIAQRTAAPTRWTVDGDESSVEFAVKTFWGLMTVPGHFDGSTARTRSAPAARRSSSRRTLIASTPGMRTATSTCARPTSATSSRTRRFASRRPASTT
jgi:hypothetical protein